MIITFISRIKRGDFEGLTQHFIDSSFDATTEGINRVMEISAVPMGAGPRCEPLELGAGAKQKNN